MPRQRRILVTAYGRETIAKLSENFPEYKWYITYSNEKALVLGTLEGKVKVAGPDYESIAAAMNEGLC